MPNYIDVDIITLKDICIKAVDGVRQYQIDLAAKNEKDYLKVENIYKALPWYKRLFVFKPIPPGSTSDYGMDWFRLAQNLFDAISVFKDHVQPTPTLRLEAEGLATLVRYSKRAKKSP